MGRHAPDERGLGNDDELIVCDGKEKGAVKGTTSLRVVATVMLPNIAACVSPSTRYPRPGVVWLSFSQNCMAWGRTSSCLTMSAILFAILAQPGSWENCRDAMVSTCILDNVWAPLDPTQGEWRAQDA